VFIWRNSKNGGATDCCTQQFSRAGFGIIQIKIGHLKGENKWESSGRLDLNNWTKLLKGTN